MKIATVYRVKKRTQIHGGFPFLYLDVGNIGIDNPHDDRELVVAFFDDDDDIVVLYRDQVWGVQWHHQLHAVILSNPL